jgi:hypothetical protein
MMALDASSMLGSPQLAGVKVNPRGAGKSKAANFSGVYAGVVGAGISAAAGMRAEQEQQQTAAWSEMPKFGRLAYLAVTEGEVALIDANAGSLTVRLGEIIARIPRSEVVSAELDGGGIYSPPLTITFASGDSWQLEVPRPSKKHAKQVVQVLGTAL